MNLANSLRPLRLNYYTELLREAQSSTEKNSAQNNNFQYLNKQ